MIAATAMTETTRAGSRRRVATSASAPTPAIADTITAAIPGHVVSPCQSSSASERTTSSETNAIAPETTAAQSARVRKISHSSGSSARAASAVSQTAEM